METPTLRERQKRLREDAILDAAHELLTAQSYATVTMEDIAARAGISKPTLYQHFPSKEELVVRVMVRYMRAVFESIRASEEEPMSGLQRLERTLRQTISHRFGVGRPNIGMEHPHLIPILLQNPDYLTFYHQVVALLTELVEAAKREGSVTNRLSTPQIVQMLVSLFRNPEYEFMLSQGVCTAEELTEMLLLVVFDGIRVRD